MLGAISEVIEEPITGFRALRMYLSENTPAFLSELRLQWDSSARATYDLPYSLKGGKKQHRLVELPETGPMDWKLFSFLGYSSEEGANALKEELTQTYEKETMFLHILHPWQIAAQDYLTALDTFLSYVKSFSDVWVCHCRELAGWWVVRQQIDLNWQLINEQECQISISNNSDLRIDNLGVLIEKFNSIKINDLLIQSKNPIEWKIISKKESKTVSIILTNLESRETIKVAICFR